MPASAFRALLSRDCILCGLASDNQGNICSICTDSLPFIRYPCRYCGIETIPSSHEYCCGPCAKQKPVYNRCIAVMSYKQPARDMISQFKFNGKFAAGQALGDLLAAKVAASFEESGYPDALIPIPLHRDRLRERGFNQALQLARQVAAVTKVPLLKGMISRIRNTQPQTAVNNAQSRKNNLKNAFSLGGSAMVNIPKQVALIDDVVTTQATIAEASRTLYLAGVADVKCYCIARASRQA